MPMLEQKRGSDMGTALPDAAFEQQQRRRMLIALAVLLLALISVLIKDRQFWFPPSPSSESETAEQSAPLRSPLAARSKIVTPIAPHKPVRPASAQARPKSALATRPSRSNLAPTNPTTALPQAPRLNAAPAPSNRCTPLLRAVSPPLNQPGQSQMTQKTRHGNAPGKRVSWGPSTPPD